jgi:signal transduction histidine kinase
MAQVLGNLIGNALRYTPSGGRITLAARRRDGAVAIDVADTGAGIPASALPARLRSVLSRRSLPHDGPALRARPRDHARR